MRPLACPECGDTYWRRIESGHYTEEAWIETSSAGTEVRYEDTETDMMDSTPWECRNDHKATPEIAEAIEEMR